MKYKAGDQVRIKSLDWYNKNIKNNGIIICGSESFTHPMSHFCDKVVTIVTIQDNCYRILEDDGDWYWTDEMIEGLVEEEIIDLTSIVMETVEEKTIQNTLTYGYNLPEGYQFIDENGNIINATKIVLEKKKKEYDKGAKVRHKTKGMVETIVGLCKVKVNESWVDGVIYEGNDVHTGEPMTFVRVKEDFENNFEVWQH